MTPAELAARFVRLPGWRWAPGMLTEGGYTVLSVSDDGYLLLAGAEGSVVSWWPIAGHRPDLTDPATQGAIVAWAREVLGAKTYAYPLANGWNIVRGGKVLAWGATEMEAWLLALEAAAGGRA